MSNILRTIGLNIRYYRAQLGLSQERLAENSELHRTYIGAVERGERNISANNISKIAAVLGVEPYLLLKETKTTNSTIKKNVKSSRRKSL